MLITRDGTLGVTRVVETDREFSIFVSVALLKPIASKVDPYFLRHALESKPTQTQFALGSAGAALKHIVPGTIGNVRVPLPPLVEQRAIGNFVQKQARFFDRLVGRNRDHIDRLREYRQALITAAVTGKLDVSLHLIPTATIHEVEASP